jgi:ABC-2 type transport system ATP-binding protein
MVAIEIDVLTKRYGKHVAVDGLNLTVRRGEALGFLGPNGAGKSTTINVLLDYIRPTEGTAQVLGYDTQTETQAIHERVGVLPDGFSLYDRFTGREHLRLAAQLKGTSVDVSAVCDRIGLDETDIDRQAKAYSKGMSQRLAIGMATVGNPDLLILDEPTAGLDPHGVSRLKRLLEFELDRGTTVFFSSHILDHVESTCDRVAILDEGRLVTVDTIDGLREAVGSETLTLEELFAVYTDDINRDSMIDTRGAD